MLSIERASDRGRGKVGPHRELGRLLLQAGLITEDQLREALVLQRRLRERLGSVLVRQGVLTEKFAVAYLGTQLGVPGACLSRQHFDLDLLQLIPLEMCEKRMVFPLRVDRGRLTVAMKDPLDVALVAEIERHRKVRLEPNVALEVCLRHTLNEAREALKAGRWRVKTDVHRVMPAAPQAGANQNGRGQSLLPAVAGGDSARAEALAAAGSPPSLDAGEATEVPPLAARPVALTRALAEATPVAPAAMAPPLCAEKTVLLIHAAGPARSALERMLAETPGRRVLTASSGAEAFALAGDAHLLIVDAALPDTHGLELCRRLHAHRPDVPILLLSCVHRGWRFAREVKDALGVTAYVEKPFKVSELLSCVGAALGQDSAATPTLKYARKHLQRGMAALLRGDLGDAQAAFFRGLELDPASDLLHYYAGMAFEKQEQSFEAIDHYEEAVRLNPDFEDALVLLAGLYDRSGFRLKAVETWERALEGTRDDRSRAKLRAHIADRLQVDASEGEPVQAA